MTKYERAMQLWPVLVLSARNQQRLSYRVIETITGIAKQGVGECLGPIQDYCTRNNLPPLTSLVIKEDTGLPGAGFTGATEGEVFKAQARCFVFDWTSWKAPSVADFETEEPRKQVARAR